MKRVRSMSFYKLKKYKIIKMEYNFLFLTVSNANKAHQDENSTNSNNEDYYDVDNGDEQRDNEDHDDDNDDDNDEDFILKTKKSAAKKTVTKAAIKSKINF
jgi:hypothetical protein